MCMLIFTGREHKQAKRFKRFVGNEDGAIQYVCLSMMYQLTTKVCLEKYDLS